MDGMPRFYYGSVTKNEHMILDILGDHGDYVRHDVEAPLARRFRRDWEGVCKYADILALFRKEGTEYLVGIEIKDWKGRVTPKMCYQYLKTYRHGCQYVYIAARKFSLKSFEIHELGFIDLDRMKVIKKPEYLYPRKKDREGVIMKMRDSPPPRRRFVHCPDQWSLDDFG